MPDFDGALLKILGYFVEILRKLQQRCMNVADCLTC
jgi:hypothetical protein